jgi:hypothetical protein
MWVLDSGRTRHSSHHGTHRATLRCRAAAAGWCALLLGVSGACIDEGPLFSSEDVSLDAGAEPAPGLGGGGSAGAAGTGAAPSVPPGGEGPPLDAGLSPTEGPPLPGGPIDAPPGCDARDGGSGAGCEAPPEEEPVPPEDECNDCLSASCAADVERCDDTDGCDAIVACARRSGCELDACYCGTFNELLCSTTGQANGPCRDVMLAAPGAHPPNFVDPSAGPASVAARAVGACRLASDECRAVCGG